MLFQQILQLIQVPSIVQAFIKQACGVVSSIERWIDGDRAPECPFQEFILTVTCKSDFIIQDDRGEASSMLNEEHLHSQCQETSLLTLHASRLLKVAADSFEHARPQASSKLKRPRTSKKQSS